MTVQHNPLLRAVLAASISALIVAALGGCGAPSATTSTQTSDKPSEEATVPATTGFGTGVDTAQGHFTTAEKAMKAVAPDALFISVQTGVGAAVTDPSPVWMYLFASRKNNKAYAVTVVKGKAGKPLALKTEALRGDEWAKVPTTTAKWKIDSDIALERAAAAYTERLDMAPPKKFTMGMAAFVAEVTTDTIKPFTWAITYEAEEGAAVPGVKQVQVNATTGKVLPLPE